MVIDGPCYTHPISPSRFLTSPISLSFSTQNSLLYTTPEGLVQTCKFNHNPRDLPAIDQTSSIRKFYVPISLRSIHFLIRAQSGSTVLSPFSIGPESQLTTLVIPLPNVPVSYLLRSHSFAFYFDLSPHFVLPSDPK